MSVVGDPGPNPRLSEHGKENPNTSSSTSFVPDMEHVAEANTKTISSQPASTPTTPTPSRPSAPTHHSHSPNGSSQPLYSIGSRLVSPSSNQLTPGSGATTVIQSQSRASRDRASSVVHFIKLDGEALRRLKSARQRSSFAAGEGRVDASSPDFQIAISQAGSTSPIILTPEEFTRAFRGRAVHKGGTRLQFEGSEAKHRRVHWADDRNEKLERVYYSSALHYSEGNLPYDDYEEARYSSCCTIC